MCVCVCVCRCFFRKKSIYNLLLDFSWTDFHKLFHGSFTLKYDTPSDCVSRVFHSQLPIITENKNFIFFSQNILTSNNQANMLLISFINHSILIHTICKILLAKVVAYSINGNVKGLDNSKELLGKIERDFYFPIYVTHLS